MKVSLGAKTLLFPTPAWVIGSYDQHGKSNIMTVAWGGICNSKPPQVTISLRKATYTYGCIMERKAYTINHLPESLVAAVDYCGMASGRAGDKFAETGLTPIGSDLVDAPYIEQANLVIECSLSQAIEVGLHTMFIGEIVDVKADQAVLDESGNPDPLKLLPIIYATGVSRYFGIGNEIGKGYSVGKALKKSDDPKY